MACLLVEACLLVDKREVFVYCKKTPRAPSTPRSVAFFIPCLHGNLKQTSSSPGTLLTAGRPPPNLPPSRVGLHRLVCGGRSAIQTTSSLRLNIHPAINTQGLPKLALGCNVWDVGSLRGPRVQAEKRQTNTGTVLISSTRSCGQPGQQRDSQPKLGSCPVGLRSFALDTGKTLDGLRRRTGETKENS